MSWRTNRRTRNRFMLRRAPQVATATLEDLAIARATSKFLPREQQARAEGYVGERLLKQIHEEQDTLDVRLHREESIAGEEKLKEIWRRETGNTEPKDNEEARKQYYLFENWRAERLFNALCPIYGGCRIPIMKFYHLAYDRKDQQAVNLLADSFGVPRVKVTYGPFEDNIGQFGEYLKDERKIQLLDSPQSPYFLAHEFFHYLLDQSPRVKIAEKEAVRFLETLQ